MSLLSLVAFATLIATSSSIPMTTHFDATTVTTTTRSSSSSSQTSTQKPNKVRATPANITVAAFVYDPWTPEPAVFGEHGPNFTEWELVKRATPRFPGHLQPHVPLHGYFDTALPQTWDLLNADAIEHGITAYLWDWYWWSDAPSNPLLVRGLEEGFLHAQSSKDISWGVMWANQDWVDLFPSKRYDPSPTKFHGVVNASVFTELSQYWIDAYFHLDNYMVAPDLTTTTTEAVTNCPVVSIYEINVLVQGLGGMNETVTALNDFRARAASAGFPCVHLMVMGYGARSLPKPLAQSLQFLGVNSVTDYCFQHYAGMPDFPLTSYPSYAAQAIGEYDNLAAQVAPIPYIPNFGVAWDPSPRTVQSDLFDNWGYPATPILQPTPAEIQTALTLAADKISAECDPAWCLLTVYAYTEFSEGGSLFPTVADGYGRLQAFQAVFGNRSVA